MAGLSARTVAAIAFLGRGGGLVKALGGFRKGHHTLPEAANAATEAFLARICAGELTDAAEALFQSVRTGLGYRRAEISLSITSPVALLTTKDFVVEHSYALAAEDPARYVTLLALRELRSADLARTAEFEAIFARRFTEVSFALTNGVSVEAVIDAIEGLERAGGLTVDYPSDCRQCEISVDAVDANVRCTNATLELVFPRAGSPAELMEAFAAVRTAFAISPELRGLIG